MKNRCESRERALGGAHREGGEILREQIPLRDMSDCLLAVYDEVSRRAFQRCIVRGAQEGSDKEDWKAAEDDLFARISVDFEEAGGNLYALASVPGCAGAEITVAVDEFWLLICGYTERALHADLAEDFGVDDTRRMRSNASRNGIAGDPAAASSDELCESRERLGQGAGLSRSNDEHDRMRCAQGLCSPRPFCVVPLRSKVDPGRSVAVLSNGLLAIRMGKATVESPVPRVA